MTVTKDMFFQAIKVRDAASARLGRASDFYFDEAQWYMEPTTLKVLMSELEKLQSEVEKLDSAVSYLRGHFTKEELREMRKEFRGQ